MTHHHHHGHGHDHGHDHNHIHDVKDIRPLRIAIILSAVVFVIQAIGSVVSGAISLFADAGHVLVDVASLLIAYIGLKIAATARESHDVRYTFGMRRFEILAALTNGFLLLGICIYVIIESVKRFYGVHHIHEDEMLVVAIAGFVANAISAWYLHGSEHITTRSAYLHVITDLVSSVGVIIGAILLKLTGWLWLDPVISLCISAIIIRSAIRVIRQAGTILMESSPAHITPDDVTKVLLKLDGIEDVHDIHVWQLGADDTTATVHVVSSRDGDDTVRAVQNELRNAFGINHSTVQVESKHMHDAGDCGSC